MKGHPPTSDFVKTSLRAEISLCTIRYMRSYSNEGLLYMYKTGFQNDKKNDAVFLEEFCLNLPKNVQFGITDTTKNG